jgi:hypothetical protein
MRRVWWLQSGEGTTEGSLANTVVVQAGNQVVTTAEAEPRSAEISERSVRCGCNCSWHLDLAKASRCHTCCAQPIPQATPTETASLDATQVRPTHSPPCMHSSLARSARAGNSQLVNVHAPWRL